MKRTHLFPLMITSIIISIYFTNGVHGMKIKNVDDGNKISYKLIQDNSIDFGIDTVANKNSQIAQQREERESTKDLGLLCLLHLILTLLNAVIKCGEFALRLKVIEVPVSGYGETIVTLDLCPLFFWWRAISSYLAINTIATFQLLLTVAAALKFFYYLYKDVKGKTNTIIYLTASFGMSVVAICSCRHFGKWTLFVNPLFHFLGALLAFSSLLLLQIKDSMHTIFLGNFIEGYKEARCISTNQKSIFASLKHGYRNVTRKGLKFKEAHKHDPLQFWAGIGSFLSFFAFLMGHIIPAEWTMSFFLSLQFLKPFCGRFKEKVKKNWKSMKSIFNWILIFIQILMFVLSMTSFFEEELGEFLPRDNYYLHGHKTPYYGKVITIIEK